MRYLRPTPIDVGVEPTARVTARSDTRPTVKCTLSARDKERATAVVESALVPDTWATR